MPVSSRLQMEPGGDRLSLAYNTFFVDLFVPLPSEKDLAFRFAITGKGTPAEEPKLTLQLCLKPGEELVTAAGKRLSLSSEHTELAGSDIGGSIRHHGWTMTVAPAATLVWPVYPHNPYANGPEKTVDHAVGALSIPLRLKDGKYIRPGEQEISLALKAD